jgi:hypothetical protein
LNLVELWFGGMLKYGFLKGLDRDSLVFGGFLRHIDVYDDHALLS